MLLRKQGHLSCDCHRTKQLLSMIQEVSVIVTDKGEASL